MEKTRIEVNGVFFEMLPVEGGHFTMGATSEQHGEAWENENPVHDVYVENFYMGETVVTQALWQAVMADGETPCDDHPQTGKNWTEWQDFISKLGKLTGNRFRMPTEAEWEYAARGGAKSRGCKYAGGDNLDAVAWFDRNSGGTVHPVKQKLPNELGFYDMSGNVWEWCADWYGEYERAEEGEEETALNPQGPKRGRQRVVRGASSTYYARSCRVSCRLGFEPTGKNYAGTGLRLAMDEHPAAVKESDPLSAQGGIETPHLNPFMGATGTDKKPTGNPSTGTSTNTGHYWGTAGTSGGKKKVWPWMAAIGVALLVALVAVVSGGKDDKEDDKEMVQNITVIDEPVSEEMRQQQCIDSIKAYMDESKGLFQLVKDSLKKYDLQSYEKWLPTLNKIDDNCRAAYWLMVRLPEEISEPYFERLDEWEEYREYVANLYNKEVDNYKTTSFAEEKEKSKKRYELLEQCGLLYPD